MTFHNCAQSSLDAQDDRWNSAHLMNLLTYQHFAYIFTVRILDYKVRWKLIHLIFIIIIYCICGYASVEIKTELKNILNFGYGINFKYKGMLAHLFNRFYVVTKFILPTINELKFSRIKFNEKCEFL